MLTGRALCISKRTNTLVWVINGKPQMRRMYGSARYETPTREGAFSIGWKSPNHVSTIYHTPMPYAMFFSGGQAVHYSADFAARGYAGASHGCVNVRNLSGITSLYSQVRVGDKVIVSLISSALARSVRAGQDQRTAFGDGDGVLGMGALRAVPAAQRPAVSVGVDLVGALKEPRLDRDHQPGAQRQSASTASVVGHMRVAVHSPADPVATEFGVDLVAGLSGDSGDRERDVTDLVARLCRLDAGAERGLGRRDQSLVLVSRRAGDTLSAESATQPSTLAAKSRLTRSPSAMT